MRLNYDKNLFQLHIVLQWLMRSQVRLFKLNRKVNDNDDHSKVMIITESFVLCLILKTEATSQNSHQSSRYP